MLSLYTSRHTGAAIDAAVDAAGGIPSILARIAVLEAFHNILPPTPGITINLAALLDPPAVGQSVQLPFTASGGGATVGGTWVFSLNDEAGNLYGSNADAFPDVLYSVAFQPGNLSGTVTVTFPDAGLATLTATYTAPGGASGGGARTYTVYDFSTPPTPSDSALTYDGEALTYDGELITYS